MYAIVHFDATERGIEDSLEMRGPFPSLESAQEAAKWWTEELFSIDHPNNPDSTEADLGQWDFQWVNDNLLLDTEDSSQVFMVQELYRCDQSGNQIEE